MTEYHKLPTYPGYSPTRTDIPIPNVYPVIDNDLTRDTMENDIPATDRKDL